MSRANSHPLRPSADRLIAILAGISLGAALASLATPLAVRLFTELSAVEHGLAAALAAGAATHMAAAHLLERLSIAAAQWGSSGGGAAKGPDTQM